LFSSRKYPYSPHRRDWNFLGDGGFCKTDKFKEMCEAQLEFPEGWGGGGGALKKFLSGGGAGIFWEPTLFGAGLLSLTLVPPKIGCLKKIPPPPP